MLKMSLRSLVVGKRFSLPLLTAAAVVTLAGNAAHAGGYPVKLVGDWNGVANNSAVVVTVSFQSGVGICRAITGWMGNKGAAADSNIQGFYCPSTGKVTFERKSKANGVTFQNYTAFMAQADGVYAPHMGGMFAELVNPNAIGEYSFEAYLGPINPP